MSEKVTRRDLLKTGVAVSALTALGVVATLKEDGHNSDTVWQLDPDKCIQCEKCATACVMTPSAVKCIHAHDICGFCDLCSGFFYPDVTSLDTAAENQLCPTSAIIRTFIEDPYYEYSINEKLCIGCARCVKGCNAFGNGSLFLQIRHDRCLNCNDCAIARQCPAQAFKRVPIDEPYILKGQ